MTGTPWVSSAGTVLRDLVPAPLRRAWVACGHCPDRDLFTLFAGHVKAAPRRVAVVDADGAVDYSTLDVRVRRIAAALADRGLGARDIVAVRVPNGWRAVAAELAVAAVGAVALPWPTGSGRRDTASLLGRARANAAIVALPRRAQPEPGFGGGEHAPRVAGRAQPEPGLGGGEHAPRLTGSPLARELAALRPELPHLRAVFVFGGPVADGDLDGVVSLAPWLADEAAGREWSPGPVDPEAPARILVSSGTEAEPKMIAYSHNAMAGGRGNYLAALHPAAEPMRNLVLVPLSSSFGSCGTAVTVARHGGTLVLQETFDAAAAVRLMSAHRPSLVLGVPTMLARLAARPADPAEDLSGLRALVSSGAALDPSTVDACRRRFGRPVVNVYGSADGVNCHDGHRHAGHGETGRRDREAGRAGPVPDTAVGRPDPAVAEIRVVDGEIRARGPMTPLCYVNAPELDARYRTSDGWVRTGDRGRLDDDGTLHVVGRLKQIVIRGGDNISPAEVERELRCHPAVDDAVCLGVPDAELGERLCAFVVVSRPPQPTLGELNRFLEGERGLARRKLPELLVTLGEFPMGPTGKVCRRTLAAVAVSTGGTGGTGR